MDHSKLRREFLTRAGVLGIASVAGLPGLASAAETRPEVRSLRLVHAPAICLAPQLVAGEFLRQEGFSDISYVEMTTGAPSDVLIEGRADATMDAAPAFIPKLDAGQPIVVLAGIHSGCYELFANESVRSVRDLKGKTISIMGFGAGDHILVASMLAYVGLDPQKDVKWIKEKTFDSMRLFVEGKSDAFLGFAPQPQAMRALKVGRVIVNTGQDRPWSQYFCCMVAANRDFARHYPVATKKILRSYLKASDLCANNPGEVARRLVSKGYESEYLLALEIIGELPYNRWREYDPEDTLRFHALRLHEVGMIKSNPQKLIAQGTDWHFLNELKRELKA